MKATVITEVICDSILGLTHGQVYPIKRLIVPEADNLAITIYDGRMFAWTGFDLNRPEVKSDDLLPATGKIEIIGEVEIPDELVQKALDFVRVNNEFAELKGQIEALLE